MLKKTIIFSVVLFSFLASVHSSLAQSCPQGLENDPYPGECGLYVDKNRDGICDLSETEEKEVISEAPSASASKDAITGKEMKAKTVSEVAALYQLDAEDLAETISQSIGRKVKVSDSFQLLHDNYGLSPDSVKDLIVDLKTGSVKAAAVPTESGSEYYMAEITVFLAAAYLFSLWLVKKKYLSLVRNRKMWNFLLLFSFFITAFTSIFVLLRLNYGIIFYFPLNLVFWHIEIGYVMLVISVFHTLWHWPYLKSYFSKK